MKNSWKHIPHLYYLILLVLAGIFYKERIIFLDSAVYIYEMIQFKSFLTPHKRFINVFPELLPVIGIYLKLPLKSLLILYSISFVLCSYVNFIILTYFFKQPIVGWINAMIAICGVYLAFFYPVSEVHLALSAFCLFVGFISSDKIANAPPMLWWLGCIFILFFTIFSHGIILPFLLLYIGAITFKRPESLTRQKLIGLIIFIVVTLGVKKLMISTYEVGFTTYLWNGILNIKNYRDFHSYFYIMHLGWHVHFPAAIFILLNTILLSYYKKWGGLAYYWLAVLIAFSLPFFTYSVHWTYAIAHEIAYYPFMLVSMLPLAFYPKIYISKSILFFVLSLLPFHFMFKLQHQAKVQHRYIQFKEKIIEKAVKLGGSRFYTETSFLPPAMYPNWTLASETILLSTIINKDHPLVLYFEPHETILNRKHEPDFIFTSPYNGIYSTKNFNITYFRLKEGSYRKLDAEFFEEFK